MSGQFPGERWDRVVTRLVQRRRILALLDRLEAQAERVELLDLPKRWSRDAQELAGVVRNSVGEIRDFLVAPDGDDREEQHVKSQPQVDSVPAPSRVSSGSPDKGDPPGNVYEFRPRRR